MASEFPVFAEKLRVLVVDDDPVCVKIITRMLNHCNYQVTESAKATEALETLKKNPKGFDMVITDTSNDIDVLSLLVTILTFENIPVILVSGLEDTSTLIKGVLKGADEVLSKPVSLAKIKTLWQHVYRRRLNTPRKQDCPDSSTPCAPSPCSTDGSGSRGEGDDVDEERRSKKMRVRWVGKLQERFLQVVVELGGPEKALPKKIMEKLDVPEVSRESVASHLQKYRKQKKPVGDDMNVVFSSTSPSSSVVGDGTNFSPHLQGSHSCFLTTHQSSTMTSTPPRFGYRHQNQGFQHGSMAPKIMNGHNNFSGGFKTVPYSRCPNQLLWNNIPKVEPHIGTRSFGFGPVQHQSMLPHLPPSVTSHPQPISCIASTGGYNTTGVNIAHFPPHSSAYVPPASLATDNNNYTAGLNIPHLPPHSSSYVPPVSVATDNNHTHTCGLNNIPHFPPQSSAYVPPVTLATDNNNTGGLNIPHLPPVSVATDNNYYTSSVSYPGEPWMDASNNEDTFLSMDEIFDHGFSNISGLQADDQWLPDPAAGNRGAGSAQLRDEHHAAGGSNRYYF